MRVLVGPFAGSTSHAVCIEGAAEIARALAGPDGSVVSLDDIGVRNLSRRLSAAEVASLRQAFPDGPEDGAAMVGYVCGGARSGTDDAGVHASMETALNVLAVTDHVNLTWWSPLVGPNDESAGPRFPSMTGVYAPDMVSGRLGTGEGMIVTPCVVAGVHDDSALNAFEARVVEAQSYVGVSSELVPVVIVAAHMGLRVAASVVVTRC
jgi:hypothetical protein